MQKHPLTKEEFDLIFGKVPRLTVEVAILTDDGLVMTKIPKGPMKGRWNVPGGTVRFNEKLVDAAKRVAKAELDIDVAIGDNLGYIEYPELLASGERAWPVGMVFEATIISGELTRSDEGEAVECFKKVPENTIASQAHFFSNYLQKIY
jgi:ADP-ribose pyrophosphatase YjhB (NUDIX family)